MYHCTGGGFLSGFDITARNEVGARLCFYTCEWFCSRGGSASVHAGIPPQGADSPKSRHPPPSRHPPRSRPPPVGIPQSRHPQDQAPPLEQTPMGSRQPPPGPGTPWEQTPPGAEHARRYGQRAGGTHPTGMQSCLFNFFADDLSVYREL